MKIFITLFAFFLSLVSSGQSTPQETREKKTISVAPAKLDFNLGRGQTSRQTVKISNTTSSPYQFSVELKDWERDSVGKHNYFENHDFKNSCAGWITLDKAFINLKPGESENVIITMTVPDSPEAVTEMKWTMLVFATVAEKKINKSAKVSTEIIRRAGIGVHIYQTPPSITAKEVKMLDFARVSDTIFRISCKNTGGLQVSPAFSVELSGLENESNTVLGPFEFPLFPGQNRVVDFKIPSSLAKGKYLAVALIDVGDDDVPLQAAQAEIEIN